MALGIVKYAYDRSSQLIGVIWFVVSCHGLVLHCPLKEKQNPFPFSVQTSVFICWPHVLHLMLLSKNAQTMEELIRPNKKQCWSLSLLLLAPSISLSGIDETFLPIFLSEAD